MGCVGWVCLCSGAAHLTSLQDLKEIAEALSRGASTNRVNYDAFQLVRRIVGLLCICVSGCLGAWVPGCLYDCVCARLRVCLCVCVCVCLCVCVSVCVCVC